MILLNSKNVAQLGIEWIAVHPWLFFSIAFVFIFLIIHGENLFTKQKKTITENEAMDVFDISTPSTFDALNQNQLDHAETLLGYKLPNLLKQQLLQKNGGATHRFTYQVKGNAYEVVGDKRIYLNSLLGIDTKFSYDLVSKQTSILNSVNFWEQEILPSEMLVVAEVGSGWLILDYTKSLEVPKVKYWNPSLNKSIALAPTWEDFCDGLLAE